MVLPSPSAFPSRKRGCTCMEDESWSVQPKFPRLALRLDPAVPLGQMLSRQHPDVHYGTCRSHIRTPSSVSFNPIAYEAVSQESTDDLWTPGPSPRSVPSDADGLYLPPVAISADESNFSNVAQVGEVSSEISSSPDTDLTTGTVDVDYSDLEATSTQALLDETSPEVPLTPTVSEVQESFGWPEMSHFAQDARDCGVMNMELLVNNCSISIPIPSFASTPTHYAVPFQVLPASVQLRFNLNDSSSSSPNPLSSGFPSPSFPEPASLSDLDFASVGATLHNPRDNYVCTNFEDSSWMAPDVEGSYPETFANNMGDSDGEAWEAIYE